MRLNTPAKGSKEANITQPGAHLVAVIAHFYTKWLAQDDVQEFEE